MPGLRTLQRRMLGYLRQMFRGSGDEPAGRQAFPRLYDSQLEARRVLNADVPNAASQWLAVVLDAGAHANDGQADRFEISQSQNHGRQEITVSINERQVWRGAAEQLQSLRLQGSSDSDHFTIDPSIQFAGAIIIDGGLNRIDAADVIYVRPTGGESFHSVTVQDRPGTMQLRYSLIDSASERNASSPVQTLWQVSHVAQIVDYTTASQRSFELTHRDTWQLTSTHDEASRPLLQLSSSDQRYQFIAPTDVLHLSNQSDDSQQLLLRDLDLSSIGYVRLEGDRFDSIVQQGWLGSSRHFSVATGTVEIQGMIQSSSATQLTVHGSSIIQSGLIQLGSGSSAVMDSGPTGRTIIQGQLKILGDEHHAGGSITITGGIVHIDDQALIDVSGISGGGQVLIGGDRTGANPLVRNANYTTVSAGARISADALARGNGGRVIVYASDRTIVENASGLSARGGSLSGNGGFVETSGKRHLTLNGSPIVSAAAGRAGQWLIDPEAVSIVTAVPAIPDPNITYITVASLQALINAGGDVIIQTTTVNPALGDIVIEDAVLATPGVSARLILQAARDIVFNASFTGNANLGLELEAGRDVDALAVTITGINYLKIQSGRDVYLDDISLGSGSANAGTALNVVAIDTIDLSGDLITTGGHITLSGARLLVDGTAPRTIASGGSGVTAATAGNINLNGLTEIDGSVSPADLTIDARGVLNGGTVRLASVSNAVQGIRNLSVDTRGATTTGQLILDNGIAASTTIVVSGNLNFANADTQLADNVILTTQQNTSTLTIGSVLTDGVARNLQLTSDANINIASVNLTGGMFIAQVDANNDGINAFTFTGAMAAGSLQFNGSAANNDTLAAQSTLTSTVGAIAFNNFSQIQLAGDSTSQTSFTASSVTTVILLASADVFASGAINLDSTVTSIILAGATGSQNILDANGTNAAINLAAVTSTNSNVDLAIRSDRSVTLKSITLNGAQVDVQFSRNNAANDSIASFTATVTCDGLTVTGASRTNDGVGFVALVSLGAAGLSVTQVAGTLIAGSISTTTGNLTIVSDNSTGLASDLTTAGGNITLSGGTLFVEGSAPRTITSGGSGLTANTAGNINLNGLLAIDGAVSPADFTINARGVLNGGTVRLASVTNTTFGIRNLTVDTRGSSTTGQLILDNGLAASTTILVLGNLNFTNANTSLADNVVLTTQGNTNTLTLGSVVTDGAARNLQLDSDANISTGSVNLTGGSFTAQVDANNDGINSFTSTGAISAGSLQFSGSAANNDTLSAQSNLTSTVGAIAFNNFSQVQLNGDSTSQTNFTSTNVTTVELGSDADIFTIGAINLDSTVTGILLAGTSGTQNILDASGTNAAINLAAITATNANVDLAIRSDRSVTLKSVTLNGAQVDVQFSRNNPANDSSANFTAAVTSDGLTVTGAARTNDTVNFSSPLNLAAAGLSVTQVATTQVNGPITTTNGNLTINSATLTTLAGNLTTAGGNITLSGARLLVDGSAPRTIASGGTGVTANTAGNINLSGLTEIDGSVAPADLTIDARGVINGGTVRLASVSNAVQGIRNLTIDTRGSSTTGQLILDNGLPASTNIVVSGNLNFANANTQLADNVVLTTQGNTSTLTLGSVATDGVARNLQLTSDANINTGSVNLTGGALTAQVDANNDGIHAFTSTGVITAGSLQFDGSAANNDTLSAQSNLNSTVGGINLNNFSQVQLNGDSTSQTNFTATNVTTVELGSDADIFATGAINLDSTVTGILLAGTSGTQNILDASGTNAAINLAAITATNANVDLAIRSDRSVTLKSITLNGAQVDVQFSRNNPANNSSANFTAAVTSDGLTVTGTARTNDNVVFSSPLNLGAAGLNVSQVATVQINGDITATGPVVINQISNRIQLIQNGRIIAAGNINLRTGVSLIELTGASGTLNQISSSGDSATVQLANTTSALGVNLDVLSNHSIVLGSVDLGTTGSLRLEIDRNNNNAASQLTAGALRAHSLIVLGSANQDDTAVFSGTLRSETGSITLSQFSTVTINSDMTSATGVVISNIAQQLRLGTGADLLASNGNLNLLLGTGQIVSTGVAGSTNTFDARGAMNLSSLSSSNNVQIVLLANSDIQLAGANLPGSLSVTAGNNGAIAGQIESSSRLTATSLTLTSATGIGSTNELLTGASSLSATNRLSGDIRIGNQSSSTDVLQLRTEAGGDILFNQTDGPATFHRVESFADGTPAVDENRVELTVTGADLNVATTGLISNGIGRVNLKTVGSGSISLQADTLAEGSDVLMQSAANILGTGLIRGKTLRFEASSAIGGPAALRTQTTQLSSLTQSGNTNIANSSAAALNVPELRSQAGGAILLRQTGGGNAQIGSIVTGALSVSGAPNIQVINDAGSLIVNGMISAGGLGAISLQSQVDITLSSTSLLATHSESALIEANAAGRIQFQTGAVVRAGTGTPATEAVMTQIPPLITVIAVINSIGVNVDTDGVGVIDILVLPSGIGILDQNYVVIIDWGGGEIDRLPLGPLNANTPPTGIVRFDASLVPYRISHIYLQNPNTSDPTADIPVRVTAQVDALNRIRFTDSQAIDQQLSASADTLLEVTATGLVSLYFVLPQTPTIQKQLAFARDNTELPTTLTLANNRSELVVNTSTTTSVQQQRKIVLRVMIPVDEFGRVEASKDPKDDIALSPEDLTNLNSLFERLSDNRYRIYLILEDGNEILLKDILLRNHQPAEIEDTSNLSEIDHSQIPLLDDSPPASDRVRPSVQSSEANSAGLFDEDNERQPAVEESNGMFRSWRKAARRFRAG